MATEQEKQYLIQNTFRRASLKTNGVDRIQTERIPGILGQMGQPFDQAKLERFIRLLDPMKTGYLDHNAYNQLCKEFVKDPAAVIKIDADEFAFKSLISAKDFASP